MMKRKPTLVSIKTAFDLPERDPTDACRRHGFRGLGSEWAGRALRIVAVRSLW